MIWRHSQRRSRILLAKKTSSPVAALNLTTSSAGTRPRSFTSRPWALAHSRTSVVSTFPFADARAPAARRAPGGTAGTAASSHVARQCVPQRLGVRGVQVDLVLSAVEAEADRPLSGTAVDVVNEQGLHFLRHGFSPFLNRIKPILGNSGGASTLSHRDADQARTGNLPGNGHTRVQENTCSARQISENRTFASRRSH